MSAWVDAALPTLRRSTVGAVVAEEITQELAAMAEEASNLALRGLQVLAENAHQHMRAFARDGDSSDLAVVVVVLLAIKRTLVATTDSSESASLLH